MELELGNEIVIVASVALSSPVGTVWRLLGIRLRPTWSSRAGPDPTSRDDETLALYG